jgi:hypothetical protein
VVVAAAAIATFTVHLLGSQLLMQSITKSSKYSPTVCKRPSSKQSNSPHFTRISL